MPSLVLVMAMLTATQSVPARPFYFGETGSRIFVGDWAVINAGGFDGCVAGRQFGTRGTSVLLVQVRDGSASLAVSSFIRRGDDRAHDFDLLLDDDVSGGGRTRARSVPIGELLLIPVDASFVRELASAKFLKVLRDKVMIENVELNGAGAALAAAKQCLAQPRFVK